MAIKSHFLNARYLILLAQEETDEEARKLNLKKASEELTTAINNVYLEIKTTTEGLLKQTQRLFFRREKLIDTYIEYLSQDIQLSTKFVGMQLQVMNYLGEKHHSKIVLDNYQYMLNDFFNKAITKDGKSVAMLIHMNYPNYTKENMDFWYKFANEMQTVLEEGIDSIEDKKCIQYHWRIQKMVKNNEEKRCRKCKKILWETQNLACVHDAEMSWEKVEHWLCLLWA